MAVQSFTELLHKLKEVHEQEVEGWQEKVLELTNKKNCDAKRLEELYNRNQQLREQQRLLTENIKQLENMLRAGLCDRCTVTQEVAKKQQQDYESSQLQSLQHISILMSEISALMKENEKLKEEVKSLRRRIEQKNGHPEEARSPEVKRSPDPTASPVTLLTSGLKAEQPSAGGATTSTAIVKSENEHCQTTETLSERTETSNKGSEHKHQQGWSGTYPFELSKLPTPVSPTNPATWRERRAVSVDSLEPRPSPTSPSLPSHLRLLRKNPFLSEERRDRVSMPFRPHPIKRAPPTLRWPLPDHTDWVAMAKVASGAHPNMNRESSPSMLRFPSPVTPTGGLDPCLQSQGSSHPQPWSDHLPRKIVSELGESRDRRTTVSVIASPSRKSSAVQPEQIFGENLKEGEEETPLDLSSAGGSKVKETETIGTVQSQSQSDMASSSSSSSSSSSPPAPLSSPSSAHYASSPQSDPQAGDTKPQREETSERPKEEGEEEKEKKVNVEFTENLKVPTLTISLRPVVVLESLKTTGQKEQDFEQKSSLLESEQEENNHRTGRKRAGQDNEVFSRRPLKEKRMRLTVMPQGPNHGDSEQG
ncbi:RBBP8 N-terminal-like protein [Colossoma macropomum]|uniref:RBBP8 N-terminal-like protein n=1 Tax=Colossoma macropomum TaxID=42526 RepID=UPI0018643C66|nr:RBBP8 N-terminal-like protein [Colossoma macropomum]